MSGNFGNLLLGFGANAFPTPPSAVEYLIVAGGAGGGRTI